MTPDELFQRIMRIIQMRKEGLLTDHDERDMIAFNIMDFTQEEVNA